MNRARSAKVSTAWCAPSPAATGPASAISIRPIPSASGRRRGWACRPRCATAPGRWPCPGWRASAAPSRSASRRPSRRRPWA
ncbi:hypothetical protein DKG75_01325 [Zavarzinia compransoris]|uniref:Uncharacterized protein n=1 Tax=Zavarzinia compransoris TaxID=1264899 RepID=A0A317EAC7_9PROT|nr:hypothetical protein DKG75_01325 [Zavarzinia compransoris]